MEFLIVGVPQVVEKWKHSIADEKAAILIDSIVYILSEE